MRLHHPPHAFIKSTKSLLILYYYSQFNYNSKRQRNDGVDRPVGCNVLRRRLSREAIRALVLQEEVRDQAEAKRRTRGESRHRTRAQAKVIKGRQPPQSSTKAQLRKRRRQHATSSGHGQRTKDPALFALLQQGSEESLMRRLPARWSTATNQHLMNDDEKQPWQISLVLFPILPCSIVADNFLPSHTIVCNFPHGCL